MRRCLPALFFVLALIPLLSGCWFLVGAAAGGVAGYEVSQGTAKGNFDTSFDHAYKVSLAEIRSEGITSMEDAKGGWIKATVKDCDVSVHVAPLTARALSITVTARKGVLPKSQMARDIFGRIAKRLK